MKISYIRLVITFVVVFLAGSVQAGSYNKLDGSVETIGLSVSSIGEEAEQLVLDTEDTQDQIEDNAERIAAIKLNVNHLTTSMDECLAKANSTFTQISGIYTYVYSKKYDWESPNCVETIALKETRTSLIYKCSSGYSLSGSTCTKSGTTCRKQQGYYVSASGKSFRLYRFLWGGTLVCSTFYSGNRRPVTCKNYSTGSQTYFYESEHGHVNASYYICGPTQSSAPATAYCPSGFTRSGSYCKK
ncbi:hypothetical protein HUO09_17450 [Vibrio sp. Y2-5]|uniref:hypothetical protein n=1 Tax=Vibrio sp. Y2-5 TaxID=2743977 RepID=UPI0016611270|nr:hypothetical protein [Vibrio sp. Y2-5]MBD0788143.1 hypothetical protein [Vibrio sp. Y2-5]